MERSKNGTKEKEVLDGLSPKNSYWYRKTSEGLKFPLVIWSHLFVRIYFNNGTNNVSLEMVRTKKIYCQNVFVP